jgi:FlaA1/EpsC-like NDP-sugar epimerase
MNFDTGAIEPCIAIAVETIDQAWKFFNSDEGHYLFVSLATLRAIFYYLGRSTLPEANELAHTLAVALAVLLVAAVTENKTAIKNALECKGLPANQPKSSPKSLIIANRYSTPEERSTGCKLELAFRSV